MRKSRLMTFAALAAFASNALADLHMEPLTADNYSTSSGIQHFPTTPQYGTPSSTTVTVTFGSKSVVFKPTLNDISILADAKNAALITVRGRTSTPYPSAKDETLGLSRAIAARKYLIAQGVSPLKIAINYASAADFIADNSTPEGQQQNQRVEIELVYVMTSTN